MSNYSRFASPVPALGARVATARLDLASAYQLVYRSYLAKGYIAPHPSRIVYQQQFGRSSSRTLVVTEAQQRILGTLTVVGDNPLGLQLEHTFPDVVNTLRDCGRSLAEITCLAIESGDHFGPTRAFYTLTRLTIQYAYWRQYDDLLIAVHPRHERFYARCLGAEALADCRPCPAVRGNPAVCFRLDLLNLRSSVDPDLWRQYFNRELPPSLYVTPPMKHADHLYFCRCRDLRPDREAAAFAAEREAMVCAADENQAVFAVEDKDAA